MQIAKSLEDLQALKTAGCAFVPTMGALHEGHLALVDEARDHADTVTVSIFVNPTQFAPHEDFDTYPRDVEGDCAKLKARGVDIVYLPRVEDLYPGGPQITVKSGSAAQGLESDFRPHFFDGVCTVVHRLLTQLQPSTAIFGEKDYQQLMVIREMAERENIPAEIVGAEIVRDAHGLALSSRNAYLSDEELAIARQLNVILSSPSSSSSRGLTTGSTCAPEGMDPAIKSQDDAIKQLLNAGFTKVDYMEERLDWNRRLVAAWLGKTRLIDNIAL